MKGTMLFFGGCLVSSAAIFLMNGQSGSDALTKSEVTLIANQAVETKVAEKLDGSISKLVGDFQSHDRRIRVMSDAVERNRIEIANQESLKSVLKSLPEPSPYSAPSKGDSHLEKFLIENEAEILELRVQELEWAENERQLRSQ